MRYFQYTKVPGRKLHIISKNFTGLSAMILYYEYDQIEGNFFIDHISLLILKWKPIKETPDPGIFQKTKRV